MSVMSLKEYARVSNVSYEAVRQQVKRYASELEGHVHREGRQQFLDDEAVAFLDSKRQKNPVVIYQASKDEELEDLRTEKEQLQKKLDFAKSQIIEQQKQMLEGERKLALLESAEKDRTELKGRVGKLESDLEKARQETREAEKEHLKAAGEARKRERELEAKAANLQTKLDQLAVAGFWERWKILKDLKKKNKE